MSARVMNALGASSLERTICATAGITGTVDGARRLARGRPRGVAERPLRARLGLEPDVHGAAPVAQAARRAQAGRPARGGGPVPQPHRAGGRRAPAPAPGHGRRARHRHDARRSSTPGSTTRTGAAPTPRATTSCSRSSTARASRTAPPICGVDAGDDRARRARLRLDPAGAAAARRGRPAPRGRAGGLLDDRLAARADRRLAATAAAAAPTSRLATAGGDQLAPARAARTCGPARCARSTCRSSARRSPTPSWTRR